MTKHENSAAQTTEPEFSAGELLNGALEFHAAGHLDMARDLYNSVLAREPEQAIALHHLGLIAHARGDQASAADYIRRAVTKQPDYASAHSNLAAVYRLTGDFAAAIESAQAAIGCDPKFAAAYSNLGNIYEDRGEFELALATYRDACRIDPHFVEAHANAADLLRRLKRHEEGLVICDAIVEKRPEAARPYFCAGNILRELLRASEAMDAFRQAIALQPQFAEAHVNLGNLLLRQGEYDEAIKAYEQAIALNPTIAQTHCNLGAAYELTFRSAEAIDAYATALELDPSLTGVQVQLYHQRRAACDWDDEAGAEARLLERIDACTSPVPPFSFLSMNAPHAQQQKVGRLWASCFRLPQRFTHRPPPSGAPARKLKIGYLSSDFHRHATAHLMAELFERHDRSRFEIIGYSHGRLDCSEMRYRLGKAFDSLVDLRNFDDREAAQKIHEDGIDILVELKGYTQGARSEIAAQRPAPIQINYLGYPGTMGADFIDYVIADPVTLPMDQQPFYDEKIVQLPDCYQPNDTHRRVADLTPSRAECGLPETGFVFCCFNNSYKLTPHFFAIWMRLLKAVPGSVLWLFDANPLVKNNLQKEAEKHGIDPARLVFAPRLAPAEHLARHRLADLFLDCLP
ncbi:MAG TPA: tetratricopeptide repeat protein, partial [Methylovirgula sp.]|nr:tetratricopeptide repeat protein [Methylovirgula sp.]